MAVIYVKNGQSVTSTSTETEVRQLPPYARDMKFVVTSGTVRVTTGLYNQSGVIGGEITSYGTDDKDIMTVEPNNGSTTEGRAIYIKDSGVITFSW